MNLYLKILCLGALISTTGNSQPIEEAKPLVKISLSRVLQILGEIQESERKDEAPGAILLYTLDDRLDKALIQLKDSIKRYEKDHHVRLDISEIEEGTPDYTADFLERMIEQ